MLTIRQIEQSEIPQLQHFTPEDWNLDLPELFAFHFGYPYFYPLVAEINNTIIGCGIAMIHGKIGWLGTIIVLPEYRGRGIGQGITTKLVEYCKTRGCTSQILIATELGERVYRKLGFRITSTYEFYRRESACTFQRDPQIRAIQQQDIPSIKELDKEIACEERFLFIERFISSGLIYATPTTIRGFFLPDYGSGLIIAKDAEAGIDLMKYRLALGNKTATVPASNIDAKKFLESQGFEKYKSAPRMVLGSEIDWQGAKIFNRGTGYCG